VTHFASPWMPLDAPVQTPAPRNLLICFYTH